MQKYNIKGMSCAACAARVQKAAEKVSGVESCQVNLLTNQMTVEGNADSKDIIAAVESAGYGASQSDDKTLKIDSETASIKKRFIVSFSFLIVLMYLSMGHSMMSLPVPYILSQNPAAMGVSQLVLTAAVMIINRGFFINGIKGALHLSANMDTLISLGSFSSFAYSTALVCKIIFLSDSSAVSHTLYFESAAMILTLITLGKLLESIAKGKTTNAIKSLIQLAPKTACVIKDGVQKTVLAIHIKEGDIVVVRPGESIAADGTVTEGQTTVNQSALTGESIPVDKAVGDTVLSGTINITGYFKFEVTAAGDKTTLSNIIKTVTDAAASKAPISRIADRVAGVFVPIVLLISVFTAIIWGFTGSGFEFALSRAVSVLVISCPCALGLATPVSIMVSSGVGAKCGILFKNATAVEQTGKASIIVLDKTGTITKGSPEVCNIVPAKGVTKTELLKVAYALEQKSEHPLAYAICSYCQSEKIESVEISDFEIMPGSGVKGIFKGKTLIGSNIKYMSENTTLDDDILRITISLANEGKTPIVFAVDKTPLGIIALKDTIKPEAPDCIAKLKNMGFNVIMMTGDNRATAETVAKETGIEKVIADVLPQGKDEEVINLKKRGKVLFVGDGINDAPALTRADVGIAIGAGTDIAIESADIVLINSNLCDLLSAVSLSRAAYSSIKQNLFWAFFYNAFCIPLAAGAFYSFGIYLNPMISAAAMSFSSVCVVLNSMRLNFFKPYKQNEIKEKSVMKTMKIEGVMCEHCEKRIKSALESVSGVKNATVSHKNGMAEINCDSDTDNKLLKSAVENAGYKVIAIN